MAEPVREVWITGVGIVSSLGEGPQAHYQGLVEGQVHVDKTRFQPYIVHPLPPINFEKKIPRKDLRLMGTWQQLGTYAAGLALDSAGVKGRSEILSRIDMIVAAGSGERDLALDCAILTDRRETENPARLLNERLMGDLRPTLFLAQLPNLLAGNISIVFGVTGSSRTFLGEEAGIEAVRISHARIAAGESEIALVGGAHNGEREDLLLVYEAGGGALKGDFAPVLEREARGGGIALGSFGAFLVIEARSHAEARDATPLARLEAVASDRSSRRPGAVTIALERMWGNLAVAKSGVAIFSGATGTEPATAEERAFLAGRSEIPVCATGTYVGYGCEAQFSMNIALAALMLSPGAAEGLLQMPEIRQVTTDAIDRVAVTAVGRWGGEGMALVESMTVEHR